MISPDLYAKIALEPDLRSMEAFEYSVLHTHSGYLQHMERYLHGKTPSAIQVGIDPPPFGPPAESLLPVLHRILECKPLIVHGPISGQEADMLVRELPPKGVFLDFLISDAE
jgi:hypothetical protein